MMHILITGNPIDGLTFHGPFDTPEEAVEQGERLSSGDWWVSVVEPAQPDDAYPPKFVVIDEGHDLDNPIVVGPFLYEPDAVRWAASGNDRHATEIWTPEQYAKNEHVEENNR